jgi:hypothetical protein
MLSARNELSFLGAESMAHMIAPSLPLYRRCMVACSAQKFDPSTLRGVQSNSRLMLNCA